jgi:nucleoside-diphosphate-sugar epimerase
VEDTVDGILLLAESDYELPVNIGNPYTEISTIQLATLIKQLTSSKSSIIISNDEISESLWSTPDIKIAKKILNWEPKTNLNDGLKLIL